MIAVFGAVVFLAALAQGLSGFAFNMVVLMVFPYAFGYTNALALASLMSLFLVAYNGYLYRRHVDWHWIPLSVAAFSCGDGLGIFLLKYVGDAPWLHRFMGVLFILLAAYLLWGQAQFPVAPTWRNVVIIGVLIGAFGVGAPLMAAFFWWSQKQKKPILAPHRLCLFLRQALTS